MAKKMSGNSDEILQNSGNFKLRLQENWLDRKKLGRDIDKISVRELLSMYCYIVTAITASLEKLQIRYLKRQHRVKNAKKKTKEIGLFSKTHNAITIQMRFKKPWLRVKWVNFDFSAKSSSTDYNESNKPTLKSLKPAAHYLSLFANNDETTFSQKKIKFCET